MSGVGCRTSARATATSVHPSTADMWRLWRHVRLVPVSHIERRREAARSRNMGPNRKSSMRANIFRYTQKLDMAGSRCDVCLVPILLQKIKNKADPKKTQHIYFFYF